MTTERRVRRGVARGRALTGRSRCIGDEARWGKIGTESAPGVRPSGGSIDREGGGTVHPTLGGGSDCGAATSGARMPCGGTVG